MYAAAPTFYRCALALDEGTEAILRSLARTGRICADHVLRRNGRGIVALCQLEIAELERAGVPVERLGRLEPPRLESGRLDAATSDALMTGFVSSYLDTGGIFAAFDALHADFPALTEWTALPELTTGYDGSVAALAGPSAVKLFRITTTPAQRSKPGLLVLAGLHAREWAPPLAAIELATQLLRNYAPGSSDPAVQAITALVDGLDILIIPAVNPDGINYSRHDVAMWRKNRRPNPPMLTCPGVDNNRNFSIYWGQAGSSAAPCDFQVYHGPAAFSEIENRNVRWVVEQFPNILTALDCHSFGENFFRPQPTGGSFIGTEPVAPADHAIYVALEAAMNAAVNSVSPGKAYGTGTTSNHAGTCDEYLFFGHRIFGFELEIGLDFQPPIADALLSVQEAAAVMRALGRETLALGQRFTHPIALVQVLDRSGSMITFGYVETVRANGQRLVDLMSLNDQVGIVSFAGLASVEYPLTSINSGGIFGEGRAAVAAIGFGGTTSIGAGLQAAAAALSGTTLPRAVVLLSDGFENTPPTAASVLPGLPANLAVHTIALGPASDQALLQNLATSTGGTYHFSPDEGDLFGIYDVIRATAVDDDMALHEDLVLPPSQAGIVREIVVDDAAEYLHVSTAVPATTGRLEVELRGPCGTLLEEGRVHRTAGAGYVVLRIRRPPAGRYELAIRVRGARAAVRCAATAFLRSPIHFHIDRSRLAARAGEAIELGLAVHREQKPLNHIAAIASATAPSMSLASLIRDGRARGLRVGAGCASDPIPHEAELAMLGRGHGCGDGLDLLRMVAHPVDVVRRDPKRPGRYGIVAARLVTHTGAASYRIRVRVEGVTPEGAPFVRLGEVCVHAR